MEFADQLIQAVREKGNPVLVGIDPRPEELPTGFLDRFSGDRPGISTALRTFGCDVIDVVATLVPAVKFQSAFYEAYGPEGLAALHATVEYAKLKGLIVIFDGKRNDIGSTAEAYARAYLGKVPVGGAFEPSWHADAMTVNPYLGTDGVMPLSRSPRASKRVSLCSSRPAMRPRVNSRTWSLTGGQSIATSRPSFCNGRLDIKASPVTTLWARSWRDLSQGD